MRDDVTIIRQKEPEFALKNSVTGQVYPIVKPIVIGRQEGVDIELLQGQVSRIHASVEIKNKAVWLTDKSSNGTFVNGVKIGHSELTIGDKISFDIHEFILISLLDENADAPEENTRDLPTEIRDPAIAQSEPLTGAQLAKQKSRKSVGPVNPTSSADTAPQNAKPTPSSNEKAANVLKEETIETTTDQKAQTSGVTLEDDLDKTQFSKAPETESKPEPEPDLDRTQFSAKPVENQEDLDKTQFSATPAEAEDLDKTQFSAAPEANADLDKTQFSAAPPAADTDLDKTQFSAAPTNNIDLEKTQFSQGPSVEDLEKTQMASRETDTEENQERTQVWQPENTPATPEAPQIESDPNKIYGFHPVIDGKQYPLAKDIIQIGKSPLGDIILPDGSVSSNHAVLKKDGDQWWLEDLQSTNGTFINGRFLKKPQLLKSGDLLQFGLVTLVYGQSFPKKKKRLGLIITLSLITIAGIGAAIWLLNS